MVDIIDVYKSLNISTGTLMKNPEMSKFVPYHLKTKKICKHAVKKLSYQDMFLINIRLNIKVILENVGS